MFLFHIQHTTTLPSLAMIGELFQQIDGGDEFTSPSPSPTKVHLKIGLRCQGMQFCRLKLKLAKDLLIEL